MKRLLVALAMTVCWGMPANAQNVSQHNGNIILAQSGDEGYRISILEEQIRQLNGRIEELNFQLLQIEDKMRRMQEDNDYRLRELEEKSGSLNNDTQHTITKLESETSLEKLEPSVESGAVNNAQSDSTGGNQAKTSEPRTIDGVILYDGPSGQDENTEGSLGSIKFDANGNIIDTNLGKPIDLTNQPSSGDDDASGLSYPSGPDGLFNFGYDQLQAGSYRSAEEAFRTFSDQYPDSPKLPEVRFWLGESYLGQGEYKEAAQTYLDAHKNWPDSKYGAQTLIKLGVSVAGLNQRELACATFAEVLEKYPDASDAIRSNVIREQQAVKCLTN